ncbi:MAG TPA: HAMP domain-containing sensor histidine kinase [Terriglobales bacterium]|nr:HAMP domain-containing sensor histidine kinase [Terriglobales bacterium]
MIDQGRNGDQASQETRSPQGDGRMRPEFVSAVSHELRSPLNVILGYGDLLLDQAFGPINEEQQDALSRIGDNALLLLDRLNAVLEYSRVQSGGLEIGLQEVNVADILGAAADSAAELAHRRPEIQLEVAGADGAPLLQTDPDKLVAAINHLVHNAFKFTESGRVRISARIAPGLVEFSVSDTGIGIAPEKLATIFEPFCKLNGNGKKGFRDFGLGLYLARAYVERLGGQLQVESQPSQGSTFRIQLPL